MADLDTSRTHRLGSRAFILFLGQGAILGCLVLIGIAAGYWYGARYVPPAYVAYFVYGVKLLALLVICYITYRLARAYLAYRAHAYRFDDEYFHITRGYLDRHETGVVYHRIQTVTVQRPVGARMMGVAHLVIHTGGSGGGEGGVSQAVLLPSLDLKKARLVQKELLARARMGQGGGSRPEPRYQQVPFDDEEEDDEYDEE